MKISISCETFGRLAELAKRSNNPRYPWLNSVAFQVQNGILVAITSDARFCAIEFLGKVAEPDCFFQVGLTDAILNQAATEKQFGGTFSIEFWPDHRHVALSSLFGFNAPGNVGIFPIEEIPLKKWRDWVPEKLPTKSVGNMFVEVDALVNLARCAPSGAIVFPRNIDVESPVCVIDALNPNWLGIFYPKTRQEKTYDFEKFANWVHE